VHQPGVLDLVMFAWAVMFAASLAVFRLTRGVLDAAQVRDAIVLALYALLLFVLGVIALALVLGRAFPELGDTVGALALGVVALNELVAPAIWRTVLARSNALARPEPEPQDSVPGVATVVT